MGALGEEASYYAQAMLEYYRYYQVRDVEGLPWVRAQLSSYTRYGRARMYDIPPLSSH